MVHCYRTLGSLPDAEDAVQESAQQEAFHRADGLVRFTKRPCKKPRLSAAASEFNVTG
jgi:hypothetical protein